MYKKFNKLITSVTVSKKLLQEYNGMVFKIPHYLEWVKYSIDLGISLHSYFTENIKEENEIYFLVDEDDRMFGCEGNVPAYISSQLGEVLLYSKNYSIWIECETLFRGLPMCWFQPLAKSPNGVTINLCEVKECHNNEADIRAQQIIHTLLTGSVGMLDQQCIGKEIINGCFVKDKVTWLDYQVVSFIIKKGNGTFCCKSLRDSSTIERSREQLILFPDLEISQKNIEV